MKKVEMRDEDTFSQMSGFSETGSQMEDSNLYSLQEINDFLDESLESSKLETFFQILRNL